MVMGGLTQLARYNRQGRKANVGAGTATATEPTREHKQYATQGPVSYTHLRAHEPY